VSAAGAFSGSWAAPAPPAWRGTFSATGPIPASGASGTIRYDFSGLAAGALPAGSFFSFGDVDGGSGSSEVFVLKAWGPGSAATPLLSPWLAGPAAAWGSGRGAGGGPGAQDLPKWAFDPATGAYTIDGSGVVGFNPTVSVAMLSLASIRTLEVEKRANNNGFGISAPVRRRGGPGAAHRPRAPERCSGRRCCCGAAEQPPSPAHAGGPHAGVDLGRAPRHGGGCSDACGGAPAKTVAVAAA
jgi:hypothetical protein